MKNRLKSSEKTIKDISFKKTNDFNLVPIANAGCLAGSRRISEKKSSFYTLWSYLFLNLPVAFNKN
ncbi:MAG TPA: hypothetical protein VN922_05155 [Bacteroidia bacterium]|nr:hypothetical protein [Bacteroidia bacterium]